MSTRSQDFLCVDYHVAGPRTAVDVHLGHSQLIGISMIDSLGRCAFIYDNFQAVMLPFRARRWIYHDAVFGRAVECKYDLARPIAGFDCTRTMGHLLDENADHDFNHLIHQHGAYLAACRPATVNGAGPINRFVPLNSAWLPWLFYVRAELPQRLIAEQLFFVYDRIELPVVEPVVAMSQTGIKVDLERLLALQESHQTQYDIIGQQLEGIAGRPINIGSSNEVSRLLFEELRLPVLATCQKSGAPSTDREALEPLRNHPAVDLVLRGRHMQAVASAARSLLDHADTNTGRVYPSLDPLGAVTGRMSCASPNLQGLPAELLEAIIADEGHTLVEIDFAQMELRVLANLAQDTNMLNAFADSEDIHVSTAASIFGVSRDCVTSEQRQIGKRVNFGIVFCQTDNGLATQLGVAVEEAAGYLGAFCSSYPRVEQFVSDTKNFAQRNRYVTTFLERRRRLPLVDGTGGYVKRERALRQAVNAVVQGTAADLNKLALARLFHNLPPSATLLLNVHDSFLVQVPSDDVSSHVGTLQAIMDRGLVEWEMAMPTTIHTGRSWAECKDH